MFGNSAEDLISRAQGFLERADEQLRNIRRIAQQAQIQGRKLDQDERQIFNRFIELTNDAGGKLDELTREFPHLTTQAREIEEWLATLRAAYHTYESAVHPEA